MSVDWEHQYQIEETPWDKGAPAPPLLEWLEAHPDTIRGNVLVPGCGRGYDVSALAGHSAAERIVGLDISSSAVGFASAQKLSDREHYELGDLFDLETYHLGAYDWVFEHTCFCAIDPAQRDDYVEAIWSVLKPAGNLLAVFYLDPYDDDHRPGGGPPHGSTVEELKAHFIDSGRFRLIESYVPHRSYPGREGLELVQRMEKIE